MSITTGCIRDIYSEGKPRCPVVQLLNTKTIESATSKRVKAEISDGEHYGVALFNGGAAEKIVSEEIKLNSSVRLKQFTTTNISGTRFCLVLEAEHVADNEEKLGEPVAWCPSMAKQEEAASTTPDKPAAPARNTPETAANQPRTSTAFSGTPAAGFGGGNAPSAASLGRPTPIEALNPYSNKWTIRVRVTHKGEFKTINSARGSMNVFEMNLCDESGEIKCTCWREAAERFHNVVEMGKVFLISRGSLRMANKKYSTVNNQYEMTLNSDSFVQLAPDQEVALPTIRYTFVKVADIEGRATNAIVDVIGVVSEVAPATRLTTKAGKDLTKRTMTLSDDSGAAIEVTLWGSHAESFPEDSGKVVAFKGLRVTEWNTKSLGASATTSFEMCPERDETAALQAWWEGGGGTSAKKLSVSSYGGGAERDTSSRTYFDEIQDADVPHDKPVYFNCRAYMAKVQPNGKDGPLWYLSCGKCNKKAMGDEASGFNCEACGWSGAQCRYRYMFSCVMQDASGQKYVSAFNDQGVEILGMSGDDLNAIKDASFERYEAVLARAAWQPMVMRVRAKTETYNETARVKYGLASWRKVDFKEEGKALLADIAKYNLPPPEKYIAPPPEEAKESTEEEAVKMEE